MGPRFDVMMQQYAAALNPPGQANGGHVPDGVPSGPNWKPYSQYNPSNWSSPDVAGRNLMVRPADLMTVASHLKRLHDELQITLSTWQGRAAAAASAVAPAGGAGGSWPQAEQLSSAIGQTHSGLQQFVTNLSQAHDEIASKINTSVDNYSNAEQTNQQAIRAALQAGQTAPSGTRVQAGGNNVQNDPTFGQPGMTPQERANIAKLIAMDGNQPVWTNTLNITAGAPYSAGSTPKVTYQQLAKMLGSTDPEAVSQGASAYEPLVRQLTDMTGKLATAGQNLASNWGGTTAVTAVSQVQQLHQTASDLQANAFSAWRTLDWYGGVLSAFKNGPLPQPAPVTNPPPLSPSNLQIFTNAQKAANETAANQAAQRYLAALNTHIETAYNNLPPALNENLPPTAKKAAPALSGGPGGTGGLTGAPTVGGGGPGGSGPGGPGSPVSGVPPVSPVTGPGGTGPGGPVVQPGPGQPPPTLSGFPPPGTPGSPGSPGSPVSPIGPVPGPGPGSPGSPVPGMPGTPIPGIPGFPTTGAGGGGSSSDGGIPPSEELPGIGGLGSVNPALGVGGTGVAGNGAGAAGDGVGVDGAGVGPADGVTVAGETPGGGFGFPGMGGFGGVGGGAGGGQGRTRQAWESEDQGLWDPQEQGLGDPPLVSSDGMIGADSVPGDWAGAGVADFAPAGGLGGTGGFGASGGFGGADGAAGSPGFPGGAGGSGAAAEDGAGFPMMGGMGGGQRDGSERQRQAWMHEDPDIWGEEADRRVPPVIG